MQKDSQRGAAGIWIFLYFLANLSLTIHNKWVLNRVNFNFPWTLTAIHISVSGLGSYLVCKVSGMQSPSLDTWAWIKLLSFSILYSINIAMSNVSMSYVSLSFHQIVRSSVPAVILMLEYLMLGKVHSLGRKASLVPLICGVALSTVGEFGDIYFTYLGLALTLFGVVLAALKGVVTNMLMVGPLSLHPLEVISTMALPATIQCLIYGALFGEFSGIKRFVVGLQEETSAGLTLDDPLVSLLGKLALNGFLAFLLNWVSFTANQKTSALTMTVIANVKQIASIALALYIFNTPVNLIRATGIVLTLIGAIWYR